MNEQVEELLKPIMIDFSQLKEGQEVYDVVRGNATILRIDYHRVNDYSLQVSIANGNRCYTANGCDHYNDKFPSLFLRDPYEYLVEVLGKSKEGDGDVSNAILELKQQRDLLLGSLEKVVSMCIALQKRLSIAPEVLTKQQIADMLGRDINSFEIKEEGE